MKRDMDLARKILLAIEASDGGRSEMKVDADCTQEELIYHVNLLYEKGYTQAYDMGSARGAYWQPHGLTWEGHDYLEAVRDDTTYRRAVNTVKEKGGQLTFEVIKAAVVSYGKAHIPSV